MSFITFEGPDGAGKTTHIRLLADYLLEHGYQPLVTREPGGTLLGDEIRSLVLGSQAYQTAPMAELLLLTAARAQHISEVLRPQLAGQRLVLCDRYIDSSLAYQGVALGLGWDVVQQVNDLAVGGLWPDLTILLDVPPDVAYQRSSLQRSRPDRIESRGLDYYRQVCAGYQLVAKRFPQRVYTIDATRPVAVVQEDVRVLTRRFLASRNRS
jgi:dTMP kinase